MRAHALRQRAEGIGSTFSAPYKKVLGKEGRVEATQEVRELCRHCGVWTLDRTSCVSQVGAVHRELHAVARVSISHNLAFFASGEMEIRLH